MSPSPDFSDRNRLGQNAGLWQQAAIKSPLSWSVAVFLEDFTRVCRGVGLVDCCTARLDMLSVPDLRKVSGLVEGTLAEHLGAGLNRRLLNLADGFDQGRRLHPGGRAGRVMLHLYGLLAQRELKKEGAAVLAISADLLLRHGTQEQQAEVSYLKARRLVLDGNYKLGLRWFNFGEQRSVGSPPAESPGRLLALIALVGCETGTDNRKMAVLHAGKLIQLLDDEKFHLNVNRVEVVEGYRRSAFAFATAHTAVDAAHEALVKGENFAAQVRFPLGERIIQAARAYIYLQKGLTNAAIGMLEQLTGELPWRNFRITNPANFVVETLGILGAAYSAADRPADAYKVKDYLRDYCRLMQIDYDE